MSVPTNYEDWFAVSERLVHDRSEGGVTNDGEKLIIGWRAGPGEPELSNMAHEMAHMIEIPHKRVWWVTGWGMRVRRSMVFGQLCTDPQSDMGTLREIRTVAIQWLLQEHFAEQSKSEIDRDILEIAKAMTWVYDYCWYTFKRPSLNRLPYRKLDELTVRRVIRDVLRYKRTLNIEQLWRQWCSKCDVLNQLCW